MYIKPGKLKYAQKQRAGRNNQGRITVRHRGGGHKRLQRVVSCIARIRQPSMPQGMYKVCNIEYDPNRSAFLALTEQLNIETGGTKLSYMLATEGIKADDVIKVSRDSQEITEKYLYF